jgi:hypothetical protein
MTKIQVSLHDSTIITTEVESYNAEEMESKMNDPKLLAIRVGNAVINKNVIKLIVPVIAAQ